MLFFFSFVKHFSVNSASSLWKATPGEGGGGGLMLDVSGFFSWPVCQTIILDEKKWKLHKSKVRDPTSLYKRTDVKMTGSTKNWAHHFLHSLMLFYCFFSGIFSYSKCQSPTICKHILADISSELICAQKKILYITKREQVWKYLIHCTLICINSPFIWLFIFPRISLIMQ